MPTSTTAPPKRKRGRPAKPKTAAEQSMAALESQIRPMRRRISGKHRAFVALFAQSGFTDPQKAAEAAGFNEPGIGWKLADRLRDLIDAERVRTSIGTQMELDEALRLCAERARSSPDEKIALGYTTLILRYHGALSDKPLPMTERRQLLAQVAEISERLKAQLGPGAKERVRAIMAKSVGGGTTGTTGGALASSRTVDVDVAADPDLDESDEE